MYNSSMSRILPIKTTSPFNSTTPTHTMNTKSHLTRNVALLAAVVLASSTSLHAQARSWVGGNGTWDDTTTANWSPNTVPVLANSVEINAGSGITVNYTATPVAADGFVRFDITNSGVGTTAIFNLDSSDILRVNNTFTFGRFSGGNVQANLSGSAQFILDGGGSFEIGGSAPSAVFNQSGGTFTAGVTGGAGLSLLAGGTYNLSGGNYTSTGGIRVATGATFNQTGASASVVLPAAPQTILAGGTWNLSNGTYSTGNGFDIQAGGSASFTGGTIAATTGLRITLTGAGASWTQAGGSIALNTGGNAGTSTLTLVQSSTVQGYGTISTVGSNGVFQNSGRVIANGGGTNRTLDFSSFTPANVTNTSDNTTNNGWFATARGTLLLPTVTVNATTSTNWGEAAGDTTIDLVNSLRLTTSAGTTNGTLSISLLAPDRTDISTEMTSLSTASGGASVIGLWDFNPITFAFGSGNLTATARFDRVAYDGLFSGIGTLGLFLYNGSTWSSVLASSDMTNNRITSNALTSFGSGTNAGLFAVTVVPEPATWLLVAGSLTALVVLRRRRAREF